MNVHAGASPAHSADPRYAVAEVFERQHRASQERRATFGYKARVEALKTLKAAIEARENDICAALAADFRKPEAEVRLTEIFPIFQEIRHTLAHLKSWMKTRHVPATLGVAGTRAQLKPEPKGVCLIIAPWNYPFNLALSPLVSALAAGNSAIIKPSEMTPHTSALIAQLVAETFPPDLVAVVEGDASISEILLALPFDHIFFTGSPQVGKIVMGAAAKTLASVTLELGGKSPTIIGPDADLKKAARNIAWGKFANNGQTCIAPDHVFVHRSVAQDFTAAINAQIEHVYGATPQARRTSPDYSRIVNQRHFARVSRLIDDATAKGAKILAGGARDEAQCFIEPTVLTNIKPDMEVTREELFGPILPIIEFDDIAQVIDEINDHPKPLALYVFSRDRAFIDNVIANTSSGGVGINLTMVHYLHPNLPFGGVNNSGIGAAHGLYGFREFSHEKPILRDAFSTTHLLFPPYTDFVKRLINMVIKLLG